MLGRNPVVIDVGGRLKRPRQPAMVLGCYVKPVQLVIIAEIIVIAC